MSLGHPGLEYRTKEQGMKKWNLPGPVFSCSNIKLLTGHQNPTMVTTFETQH
jgi:hypothetical protein